MSKSITSFKFPLVDPTGAAVGSEGLLRSVGFVEKYLGKTTSEDELVIAIGQARAGGQLDSRRLDARRLDSRQLDSRQSELLRSFATQWLLHRDGKLSSVVAYSIELQNSIQFLSQIGFLDRAAATVGGTVLGITDLVLTWDMMFSDQVNAAGFLAGEVTAEIVCYALSPFFKAEISKRFGEPGTPVKRTDFDLETILVFLQSCHFQSVIESIEGSESLMAKLTEALDHQIYSLFMLNSRQLEGLACAGTSEATAAVAAHAAIALGLADLPVKETIFQTLQKQIQTMETGVRRDEAGATLKAIQQHASLETATIERQLNRQLLSSATTEAVDLAVMPMRASLQLMSLVSGGMQSLAPGQYGQAFSVIKQGIDAANSAAASTPDVLAAALDHGISAEAWTRRQFDKIFSFAKKGD